MPRAYPEGAAGPDAILSGQAGHGTTGLLAFSNHRIGSASCDNASHRTQLRERPNAHACSLNFSTSVGNHFKRDNV